MRERDDNLGAAGAVRVLVAPWLRAALGIVLLSWLAACGEPSLHLAATFQDAQGIEAGDEVVYKGLEIGLVTGVGVDEDGAVRVDFFVRPKYRSALARNSVLEIERSGVLGGRQLTVRDGRGERLPVADGDVLVGSEGQIADTLTRLREAGADAWASVRELGADLQQQLAELIESPEAEELADSLEALREEALEGGRQGLEALDEQAAEVRRKAGELRRQLEEKGEGEQARELAESVERWLERLKAELEKDDGQ